MKNNASSIHWERERSRNIFHDLCSHRLKRLLKSRTTKRGIFNALLTITHQLNYKTDVYVAYPFFSLSLFICFLCIALFQSTVRYSSDCSEDCSLPYVFTCPLTGIASFSLIHKLLSYLSSRIISPLEWNVPLVTHAHLTIAHTVCNSLTHNISLSLIESLIAGSLVHHTVTHVTWKYF